MCASNIARNEREKELHTFWDNCSLKSGIQVLNFSCYPQHDHPGKYHYITVTESKETHGEGGGRRHSVKMLCV